MKRRWHLVALGAAGIMGAVAGGVDLYRATGTVRALNIGGITGLSVYADLSWATQESRRHFLYALATTGSNRKLPFVERARAVDQEVERLVKTMAGLGLGAGVARHCTLLVGDWRSYLAVRDEAITLILEGRREDAVALVTARGDAKFQSVSDEMRRIKQQLDSDGQRQTRAIRLTFFRAGLELLLLFASTSVVIWVLMRTLAALRRNNRLIARARSVEQSRNRILEMVGRNEPRETILEALAQYLEEHSAGARAILSLVEGDRLCLETAPGFPGEADQIPIPPGLIPAGLNEPGVAGVKLPRDGVVVASVEQDKVWTPHRGVALRHGLKTCWWSPIRSSAGAVIGVVALLLPHRQEAEGADREMMSGAARLASLAIEHSGLYHQLAHQALHDPLTALPNRLLFQDRLQQAVSRAQRDSKTVAVLWIDLDQFKAINDTLGHRTGDAVLRQVAQRLSGCVRKTDTVARIGGDEFTVILNGVDDTNAAEQVARNIVERLRAPIALPDRTVAVTASVGISLFPEHGAEPGVLVKNADIAMYEARKNGRNSARTYNPVMGQIAREQMDIRLHLATALENREFDLHYQPQIGIDGHLFGFEALIRWKNAHLGDVGPAQFIPIAEETNQIVVIGEWALREACERAALWQRSGYRKVRMAVNISAVQLMRPEFVATVAAVLESTGLEPQYLELELTETAVMHDLGKAAQQIVGIRAMGVNVSIDDFGTGYSSLSYINSLPVNGVKVDQSFVRQLGGTSGGSLALVRTIIAMAHGMDMQVVGEGVETEEQLKALQTAGCDIAQGFLLHGPLTASHAETLLQGDRDTACGVLLEAEAELAYTF